MDRSRIPAGVEELVALHTYPCIGDSVISIAACLALARADRRRFYGVVLRHPWQRALFREAWRARDVAWKPIIGRRLPALRDEWRLVDLCPDDVLPGESVIGAHVRTACAQLGIAPPAPPPAIEYVGWRPELRPTYVGVHVPTRPGRKWARGPLLRGALIACGLPAELTPWHETAEDGLEWLAGCRAFVGPDTGLAYVAIAWGIPTVLILGGRFGPDAFPYPNCRVITSRACARAPCRRWRIDPRRAPLFPHCPPSSQGLGFSGLACVDAVSVGDVLDVLLPLIREAGR